MGFGANYISMGTTAQVLAEFPYTPGMMMGFVIPFVVLTLGRIWANAMFFRGLKS